MRAAKHVRLEEAPVRSLGEMLGIEGLGNTSPAVYEFVHPDRNAPTIFVTAMIHGDEYTGFETCRLLMEDLRSGMESAFSLKIVPCVNTEGARRGSRLVPADSADLNRSFPGSRNGPLSERLAHALSLLASSCDIVVDVHTAGWCIPFVILDDIREERLSAQVRSAALSSGLPVVNEMTSRAAELQGLDGSFSAWATRTGKKAFTMELPGTTGVDPTGARTGREALKKIIRGTSSFTNFETEAKTAQKIFHRRKEIYSDIQGFFVPGACPGDTLFGGEDLGLVVPLNEYTIPHGIASSPGMKGSFVLAVNPCSSVFPGSWIITVAEKVGEER